ncbi:MAG: RsiV family protein, partial [Candidatus Sericytochromatia bacterium]
TFSHQYPQLGKAGVEPKQTAATQALNTRFQQEARQSESEFRAELKALFGPGLAPRPMPEGFKESVRNVEYQLRANSPEVLSVVFYRYQLTVGAPHSVTLAYTRNVVSGKPVTLPELFKPGAAWKPAVSRAVGDAVKAKAKAVGFDIYDPKGYGPDARNFEAFCVTRPGLQVFFQAGQVANEAMNVFDVTVPWAALRPVLKPEIERAAVK